MSKPNPFELGKVHFLNGLPRSANPYWHSAYINGARRIEEKPGVQAWFAGFDEAKESYAADETAARTAIAKATGGAA